VTTSKRVARVSRLAVAGIVGVAGIISLAPHAEASTRVATFYTGPNFTGAQRDYVHPSNGYTCTYPVTDTDIAMNNSTTFTFPFDNNISSYRVYTSTVCSFKGFDNNNWTGATFGWSQSAGTLGTMDNRISSGILS
jgi:hypothetical protein